MTSGPMRAGALPPDRQPDPQVDPDVDPRRDALRCIECEFRTDDSPGGWYELSDHRMATGHRYEIVKPARKPVTVVDIPAGQGAASLFLTRRGDGWTLDYKAPDGTIVYLETEPNHQLRYGYTGNASAALWNHLAATLPTVTDTTEESK